MARKGGVGGEWKSSESLTKAWVEVSIFGNGHT